MCVEVEFAKWSMRYWVNVLSMFLFDDTPVTHVVNGVVLTRRSSTWLLSIWWVRFRWPALIFWLTHLPSPSIRSARASCHRRNSAATLSRTTQATLSRTMG